MFGAITGIGGGMLRDILVNEVPQVLRGGLAVPALLGATVVVAASGAGLQSAIFPLLGMLVCFTVRLVALRRDVNLPTLRISTRTPCAATSSARPSVSASTPALAAAYWTHVAGRQQAAPDRGAGADVDDDAAPAAVRRAERAHGGPARDQDRRGQVEVDGLAWITSTGVSARGPCGRWRRRC